MTDNKNTILAIVLSAIVLLGWQFFIGMPQMEKQRQEAQQKTQQQQQQAPGTAPTPAPGTAPTPGPPPAPGQAGAPPQPPGSAVPGGQVFPREAVLAASPRVTVENPLLKGSIALKGGRIDDLSLTQYRETVDPKSRPIQL